jgi:hypothetical protein
VAGLNRKAVRRRRLLPSIVVAIGLAAPAVVPQSATAQLPPRIVQAQVRQGDTLIKISAVTARPFGTASINGRRFTIDCMVAYGSPVGITYLLIPAPGVEWVAMRGTLPNGKKRWIFIYANIVFPSVEVRKSPSPNPYPGLCGFRDVNPTRASGYLLVA